MTERENQSSGASATLRGTVVAGSLPLLGLVLLVLVAPEYLFERGFPLDDAWIHMVYGRNFAASFTLAYNVGEPATGATSPMWAWLLALPHLVLSSTSSIVLASKIMGFFFHCATTVVLYRAAAVRFSPWVAGLAVSLVALHPDLLAASVSGMEIALSTLVAAGLLWAVVHERLAPFALLSVAAGLARPELSIFYVLIPILYFGWSRRKVNFLFLAAGTAGSMVSWGGVALRNTIVSTRPLPATFYAKAEEGEGVIGRIVSGFGELLPQMALFELPLIVGLVTLVAIGLWLRRESSALRAPSPDGESGENEAGVEDEEMQGRLVTTAWLAGIAFCVVSFALIDPVDPPAFYHQRYILPGLPFLLLGGGIALFDTLGRSLEVRLRRWVLAATIFAALSYYAVDSVERFIHLSNDAHNIDDVQVEVGKELAGLSQEDVVWIVDAGASRYFGGGYFVDVLGLNSFQVLYPGSEAFIEAHPPDRLELVRGFSGLKEYSGVVEKNLVVIEPTTPHTVTSFKGMAPHALMVCEPGQSGIYTARKAMPFVCPNE